MAGPIVTATRTMVATRRRLPYPLVIATMCANTQIQPRTDSPIPALESTLHRDLSNRAIR